MFHRYATMRYQAVLARLRELPRERLRGSVQLWQASAGRGLSLAMATGVLRGCRVAGVVDETVFDELAGCCC